MQKQGKIVKGTIAITAITLVTKLLGYIREMLIAYYYGTSNIVDIYVMAVKIPTLLLGFLSCIGTAYTPVFTEILYKKGKKKANGYTNFLIISSIITCVVSVAICLSVSNSIVGVLAPGFSDEMQEIVVEYLKITWWNVPISAVIAILTCYLQCNEKIVAASMCMLAHGIVQIIFTVIGGDENPVFLVWELLMANVCYFVIILAVMKRNQYVVKEIYYEKKYTTELLKLLFPIFLSSMLSQINGYIDNFFASSLQEGSVASLNYANLIRTFIIMMLNTGLTTMLYPVLAKYIVQEDVSKVQTAITGAIKYVLITFIPITFFVCEVAKPAVKIFFERGRFDENSVEMTSIALVMYSVGIIGVGLRDIMVNFFYAMKDSKFTLKVSLATILINVLLNILFVSKLGVAGLALSTSLSALISSPAYFIKYKKKYVKCGGSIIDGHFIVKIFAASLVSMVSVLGVRLIPIESALIELVLEAFAAGISYVGMCCILKIDEIKTVIIYVKKLFKS